MDIAFKEMESREECRKAFRLAAGNHPVAIAYAIVLPPPNPPST